jgi:DNA-binding NtrC family response regulator
MSDTLSGVIASTRPRREQPALYIGIDADDLSSPPARISLTGLDRIEIGRAEMRKVTFDRSDGADVVQLALADLRLSQKHARLRRIGETWVFEDLDSKNGSWFSGRRIKSHSLDDADVIIVGHTALVFRTTGGEAPNALTLAPGVAPGMQTMSPQLAAQFADLAIAARTTIAIEVSGETGTGKELVARGVHALSGRSGAFVAVNCGAIASTLVEGELFGHRKGAFTGAVEERSGLIRAADHGTLFLDEIAELPAATQTALLRVLQEGEVTPVGGDRPIRVNLRIVTATHQSLDAAVAAQRFRADLRARLLGFQFALPSLRDRPEDLGLLVAALIARTGRAPTSGFGIDAVAALYAYSWPLNIRELERALASATALPRDRISVADLPAALHMVLDEEPTPSTSALTPVDLQLRDQLSAAIERHDGNLAEVARELSKDRTQIRRWMKRFGLTR